MNFKNKPKSKSYLLPPERAKVRLIFSKILQKKKDNNNNNNSEIKVFDLSFPSNKSSFFLNFKKQIISSAAEKLFVENLIMNFKSMLKSKSYLLPPERAKVTLFFSKFFKKNNNNDNSKIKFFDLSFQNFFDFL